MKIRIKGTSVRIRLSRTEVMKLANDGMVEEYTPFPTSHFRYAVQRTVAGDALSATFEDGKITMQVPACLIEGWEVNDVVSIDAHMPLGDHGALYLLLEKDFQCIDQTTEDQSDNFINPNKAC